MYVVISNLILLEAPSDTPDLWRVDLHMHTRYSPDSLTRPAALVARARKVGLARIAVTDHDTIEGALEAHALAPDLVIVGEEIDTSDGGELIAYFLREGVPPELPMREAIARLRQQGAVISISHPVDRYRHSAMGEARTLQIIDRVDALEGFNARCMAAADNQHAAELARSHGKAMTAGSDGHTLGEIGAGYVLVPPFASDPASFLSSLRQGQPAGRLTGPWPHFWSTYAKWVKRLRGN